MKMTIDELRKLIRETVEEVLKEKPKQTSKVEKLETEENIDKEIDEILKALVEDEDEKVIYKCPNCGYESTEKFEKCPKCGIELEW